MKKIPVFHVDTNVAIPADMPQAKYPLRSLEIGESFTFPSSKVKSVATQANRIKKLTEREFTIRKENDELHRIWRIK